MFIGHLAVALAAKKAEPRVPLLAWIWAGFGLDVLWPLLLAAGVETVRIDPGNTAFTPLDFVSYPWSHSLVMSAVWAALAGLVAGKVWGSSRAGWLIAAAVLSHWVLDVVSHRPDMPLWPGSERIGLGLWQSVPATFLVEGVLLASAAVLYARAFPAKNAAGRWWLAGMLVLVTGMWASSPFSPPPPSVSAIIVMSALLVPMLSVFAVFIERHRRKA